MWWLKMRGVLTPLSQTFYLRFIQIRKKFYIFALNFVIGMRTNYGPPLWFNFPVFLTSYAFDLSMLLTVTLYVLQTNKTSFTLYTTRAKIIFNYLFLSSGCERLVSELKEGRTFLGLICFNIILSPLFINIEMINNYFWKE